MEREEVLRLVGVADMEMEDEVNAVADEAKARNDSTTKRIFVGMSGG